MLNPRSFLRVIRNGIDKSLTPFEPAVTPLVRVWRRLPSFGRHLFKSMAIGLGAAVILHLARPYLPGVVPAERAATDWAINFWKDRSAESPGAIERFVFLDIDEFTYQQWGEQLFVPREKLLSLITFVVDAHAKLLVVDSELTKHVALARTSPVSSGVVPAEADDALRAYLDFYSRRQDTLTPIIFVRSIGQPLVKAESDAQIGNREDSPTRPLLSEERPSEFLETVVSTSPILHWASALIERDDDGTLRDWRLLEPTCLRQEPNVVPSIALLAWALIREPNLDGKPFSIDRFQAGLRRRFSPLATQCNPQSSQLALRPAAVDSGWRLEDPVLNKPVVLSKELADFEHRIFYKFYRDSIQADAFSRIRALQITDPQPGRPLSVDWLTGKIVVIGASYTAANDHHATPLGDMPGALVVINEINALLEYGQIRELDPRIRWTILIALIIAFSLSFSYFTKSWGTRVAQFIVNVLLFPLSLWLFQYGWWLDVVFPLMVLQAYGFLVDFQVEPQPFKRQHASSQQQS